MLRAAFQVFADRQYPSVAASQMYEARGPFSVVSGAHPGRVLALYLFSQEGVKVLLARKR